MLVRPKQDSIQHIGVDRPQKVLSKEKEYLVFAIFKSPFKTLYYVIDDAHQELMMPLEYNARLFTIVDSTLPKDWIKVKSTGILPSSIESFPIWAQEKGLKDSPGYYQRLLDSSPGDTERTLIREFLRKNS